MFLGNIQSSFVTNQYCFDQCLLPVYWLLEKLCSKVKHCLFAGADQKRMQWLGMAEGGKMSLLQEAVLSAVNAASPAARDAHALSSEVQNDDSITALQSSQNGVDVDAGMATLHLALKQDALDQDRLNAVYRKVLAAYRTGDFGRYTLDSLT